MISPESTLPEVDDDENNRYRPSLFVELLQAVFKPSEDSGIIEDSEGDVEQRRAVANQAYRLLRLWDRIPGTRADGTIDASMLQAWIKEARTAAKVVGRGEVGDSRIGEMLSASPIGADGVWPAEAVRSAIEFAKSEDLERGFLIGRRNRRGATSRLPRDGGRQEYGLASQYRGYAAALTYASSRTARILQALAESYDEDATRMDERAERLDWEG